MEINVGIRIDRFILGLCVGSAAMILTLLLAGSAYIMDEWLGYTIDLIFNTTAGLILISVYVALVVVGSVCLSIEKKS